MVYIKIRTNLKATQQLTRFRDIPKFKVELFGGFIYCPTPASSKIFIPKILLGNL